MDALTLVSQCLSMENGGVFNETRYRELALSLPRLRLNKQNLATGRVQTGTVVEFRGMIQDMFDPELFCMTYIIISAIVVYWVAR